jgi:hypothetical protein
MPTDPLRKVFHNPDERPVAVLGKGYIESVITKGELARSVLVLSDQRLYQRGVAYTRNPAGQFVSVRGGQTVSLRDVTGTKYHQVNAVALVWVAVIVFMLGVTAADWARDNNIIPWLPVFFGACLSAGLLTGYFLSRRNYFIVEYAGGFIAVDASWFPVSELEEFQKQISIQQDRMRGATR